MRNGLLRPGGSRDGKAAPGSGRPAERAGPRARAAWPPAASCASYKRISSTMEHSAVPINAPLRSPIFDGLNHHLYFINILCKGIFTGSRTRREANSPLEILKASDDFC